MYHVFQKHVMYRFCVFYAFLVISLAVDKDFADRQTTNGQVSRLPKKREAHGTRSGVRDLTGELGDQYGTPSLKIHSTKSVLKDGTPVLDLTCSTADKFKDVIKKVYGFMWLRKGIRQTDFVSVAAINPDGVIMWSDQSDANTWSKFVKMKSLNLARGEIGSVKSSFFALLIPLEPCDDEGIFKCSYYVSQKGSGSLDNQAVLFQFNKSLTCNVKTVVKPAEHKPSAVATLLEDEKINYADLALTELAAIIGLVIVLIIIIVCVVRLRKKSPDKNKAKTSTDSSHQKPNRKKSHSRTDHMSRSRQKFHSPKTSRRNLSHGSIPHQQVSYTSPDSRMPPPPPRIPSGGTLQHSTSSRRPSKISSIPRHFPPPPPGPPMVGGSPLPPGPPAGVGSAPPPVPPMMGRPPPSPGIGSAPPQVPPMMGGPAPPPPMMGGPAPAEAAAPVAPPGDEGGRNALFASIRARRVSSCNL